MEYLRVIAMFAVVAIHICITALSDFDNYSQLDAVLYASVRNVFHFAVPIFFMISGALILPPVKELPLKKTSWAISFKIRFGNCGLWLGVCHN